jgi:uncharacterized phage protein (TIGR02218 family)
MKYATPAMKALLASGPLFQADLYTITLRGGTVLRWTSADTALTVGADTWTPPTDTGGSTAEQYRIDTVHLANIPAEKERPYNFTGLAVDAAGNLYAGDLSNSYIVWKITPDGTIANSAAPDGTVFLVDQNSVWRIAPENPGVDNLVANAASFIDPAFPGSGIPLCNVVYDPATTDLFVGRYFMGTRMDILRVTQEGNISVVCSGLDVLLPGLNYPTQSLKVVDGVLYYLATDGAGSSKLVAFNTASGAVLSQKAFPSGSINQVMAMVNGGGGWSTNENTESSSHGLNLYNQALAVVGGFSVGTSPVDGLAGSGTCAPWLHGAVVGPDGNTYLTENYDETFSSDYVIRKVTTIPAITNPGPLIQRGGIRNARGLEVQTLDVTLLCANQPALGGVSIQRYALNGGFDGAALRVDRAVMATWGDTSAGIICLFEGNVAGVDPSSTKVVLHLKSELEKLQIQMPRVLWQIYCNNWVGDHACGVNLAAYTVTGIASGTPTTTSLPGAPAQPDSYYRDGVIVMLTGANAGARRSVAAYADGILVPAVPFPAAPEVGDTFSVYPGCDRTKGDGGCARFSNLSRFRGMPDIPVAEASI